MNTDFCQRTVVCFLCACARPGVIGKFNTCTVEYSKKLTTCMLFGDLYSEKTPGYISNNTT